MKLTRVVKNRIAICLAIATTEMGCAASLWSLQAAREEFVKKHPEISSELTQAIRAGRLEKGMTPEMVKVVEGPVGIFRKKGNPTTRGAWGYFSPEPTSYARSLQSYGLIAARGWMRIVHFENNAVTGWEDYGNVFDYEFDSLAKLE